MRRGDRVSAIADTKNNQEFRTPDRASTARRSIKSKTPSASTRRTATPVSSFSTSRSWRRDTSSSGLLDQPTLTQIDFVTPVSQNPPSDDGLDYIPQDSKPNPNDVVEIEDDSDDDSDYRPPPSTKLKQPRVRFEQETTGNVSEKKSTMQSDTKRGRRKSGDDSKLTRKVKGNKDKTLTQMDYVRRYLKIEPDDEVQLEYTYITPKQEEAESSDRKRRKVSDSHIEKPIAIRADDNQAPLPGPTTPKKTPKRTEIPSSQSPESPEIAVISSSQFRSATRSPLKRLAPSTANHRIKEESPEPDSAKSRRQSPKVESFASDPSSHSPTMPRSSPFRKVTLSENSHIDAPSTQYPLQGDYSLVKGTSGNDISVDESRRRRSQTPRTVVYETDADTDYGESDDDVPSPVSLAKDHNFRDNDCTNFNSDDLANDSLDLPPITQARQLNESEIPASETNLPSDASICYQRLQPTTQFPMEPLPDLNTQKLAELFPDASNPYQHSAKHLPQSPMVQSRTCPETSQTQGQTQSQDLEQPPAEFVPESSPIMRNESNVHHSDGRQHKPQNRDAVVQVESSQPVDRASRQILMGQNSRPRGPISGSSLLTSSVLESVPLPAFWFGSQDSIGEPYNSSEA
ncbi:hypothetical protein BDV59DRAFT_174418 [Aspergillus ambiguus]|uniref:uncharacterized protein n=1 Tax=Aspergillus ambiguus TaxID=176160 RepID=UPI003CCC9AFB